MDFPDYGDKGPEPPTSFPAGQADQGRSEEGSTYTWQDGDRTLRVTLQPGLSVGKEGNIVSSDESKARANSEGGRGDESALPVFTTGSGTLMTLPGGVLLTLDPDWSQADIEAFLSENDIAPDHISEREWPQNSFFIETEPGFPSLNLANELAKQEGVKYSTPNWQMQMTTK